MPWKDKGVKTLSIYGHHCANGRFLRTKSSTSRFYLSEFLGNPFFFQHGQGTALQSALIPALHLALGRHQGGKGSRLRLLQQAPGYQGWIPKVGWIGVPWGNFQHWDGLRPSFSDVAWNSRFKKENSRHGFMLIICFTGLNTCFNSFVHQLVDLWVWRQLLFLSHNMFFTRAAASGHHRLNALQKR